MSKSHGRSVIVSFAGASGRHLRDAAVLVLKSRRFVSKIRASWDALREHERPFFSLVILNMHIVTSWMALSIS